MIIPRLNQILPFLKNITAGIKPVSTLNQALLTDQQIAEYLTRSTRSTVPYTSLKTNTVYDRNSGDDISIFKGVGMDYDENRPFVAGDDRRFMNWRQTAKTGEYTLKVFKEEHRANHFILLDRRNSMRFATRQQLKATQAVKVAADYTARIVKSGVDLGGLILQQHSVWFPAKPGIHAASKFLHHAASAAPPYSQITDEPTLSFQLKKLIAKLNPGTEIIIISDFIDLTNDDLPLLRQLSDRFVVTAVQIIDPVELLFTNVGPVTLESSDGLLSVQLNTSQDVNRFNQHIKKHHQLISQLLTRAGIQQQVVKTTDNI